VDLLYDIFSDAEELRKAADHLVSVLRDGEGKQYARRRGVCT